MINNRTTEQQNNRTTEQQNNRTTAFSLAFSLLLCCLGINAEQLELDEISVMGKVPEGNSISFLKVSDAIIDGEKFKNRSATLGNALSSELGVHSTPFGGGASAPIIRGQEGVRVKILQNNADVVDMSNISPDHAITADTLLANQVEILRGASTLLYASSSPAGIVNIVDQRIPNKMPKKGYEVTLSSRFDTASKEKVYALGTTIGIGKHLALRLEGLDRQSQNYKVPQIKLGETLNYVPDTYHQSKVGTIGLSFIGEKGYLGASYNQRKDRYGLPGHNHKFDTCIAHIYDMRLQGKHSYTNLYPHLMSDEMVTENPHFHCGTDYDLDPSHSHDHPYGHDHDHTHIGPWVDLHSKRIDIKGEIKQPLPMLDKIQLSYAQTDYYHDEKDAGKSGDTINPNRVDKSKDFGKPVNIFKNQGKNARLEFFHTPIGGLTGMFGVQYQTLQSSANTPSNREVQWPLVDNRNKQISLFALEQYAWDNFAIELGLRTEKQNIHIDYDLAKIQKQQKFNERTYGKQVDPDLSDYDEKAISYTGAFNWFFHPDYQLSFTASHNERLPTPMELYYHGQHLATNSFEYGNKDLKKEISNNFELGLGYHTEKLDYKLSTYYNNFDNYIYNETLYRSNNLFMRRYNQAKATFYGLEGIINYRFTPDYQFSVFGDMVKGKLKQLPDIKGLNDVYGEPILNPDYDPEYDEPEDQYYRPYLGKEMIKQADRVSPRLPPIRLGARFNAQLTENLSGSVEWMKVFTQNKVSKLESSTKGYQLLNASLNYRRQIKGVEYTVSLTGNNLLNQAVYIHNSYHPYVPQMGRNFILGLDLSF
ncbi:TonB-dependent receptor [Glaesserella parasuis]|uniref:TonB-dependent receptor n=1 Tax=Glaesserella parasuis TaxID=738 RepID=UPI0003AC03F3|nr:TonB-dependent receptor [Glaesserella parasuis]EQA10569.1 putative tonB-dependent receptor [Glaesserella parasuis 84-15995]MDD2157383.1 TonB-dependent receptor [Glaesserella parasuis]MDO9844584.1 TonB-dependent receptor [Glaesserella parasuis]MDO9937552.1 TonB-dependent receptor [Glaesserella parasuis]MDO9954187.1 TonB-dependent receptor [Glaesserella parasuis]